MATKNQEQTAAETPAEETGAEASGAEAPASVTETGDGDGETAPAQATSEAASVVATQGLRQRKAFMLKHLIPSVDWIMKEVVGKGKGTQVTVGRVFGICDGTEAKQNQLPDGSFSDSIVMKGAFQVESYLTGELSEAATVYLPMAYAMKVAAVFKADPTIKVVEIDCDIGLEATGKPIPYEWVVIAFREGEAMAILRRIRQSRPRPASAPPLPAPGAAPALPAPEPAAETQAG